MGLVPEADEENVKGGVYVERVGKPLNVSLNHNLRDLVDFADKYGIDLELHGVGDKMEAQISTIVVIKK